jgi:phosphatidylglycerol---prolipoprotein diacylglyceryl transferase
MRPVLFTAPFLGAVFAYGTMLYLSFVVGWWLSLRLGRQDGLSRQFMKYCFVITALSALVGARLLYVVTDPAPFRTVTDVLRMSDGGLVAYGGFLGGLLGSIVFCRLRHISVLTWGDCAVPALCTGLALTRIGCFLAGCDFGQPWDGPWAVTFPTGSPAFEQQLAQGLLAASAKASLPVHPTQIYESLAGVILLGLVLWVRRQRCAHGEALAAFAMGYAVLRYAIETVRADQNRGFVGPFSTSQLIALVTFAAGLLLLGWLRTRSRVSGSLVASTSA